MEVVLRYEERKANAMTFFEIALVIAEDWLSKLFDKQETKKRR